VRIDLNAHTSSMIGLSDLADVIGAAREVITAFDHDTAWWRGHANWDWPLQAQVFRPDPAHPGEQRYDESALIGHFVSRAPTRSHRVHPAADDYFGWLFLAQHYGLPTRLLDWTENPLVALYFAVTEHQGKDGCLWALWPGGLNRGFRASTGLVQIRDLKVVDLAKDAFFPDRPPGKEIIAIDGQEIDPRMLAQMSRFTLHSYHRPMELLAESHKWLRRYVIKNEAKAKIRAQLSAMGIRRSNIFPDLASLAAELKDAHYG
jgi:FRG domain